MTRTCPTCQRKNKARASFCAFCGQDLRPDTRGQVTAGTGQLPPNSELQGRYLILRLVGTGGFGAVYEAADRRIPGKKWAVKELSTAALQGAREEAEAIADFKREAEILAHLNHPNLPAVIDFFGEGGKQYLVMEFITGHTLQQLLEARQTPFPEAKVLGWAEQMVSVLDYLHRQDPPIIFRDLKPGNIMVDDNGRLKLIDFGIARFFKGDSGGDTVALGTVGYAPPEAYGRRETDARSDVYSLGATLHQLLTNHDPGSTPFNLPPVSAYNRAVSAPTERTITRALAREPEQRFASVREMGTSLLGREGQRPQRLLRYVAAGLTLLVLAGVGIAAVMGRGQEPAATPGRAEPVAEVTATPAAAGATVTRHPTGTAPPSATPSPAVTPSPTHTPRPTATATPLPPNQQLLGHSAGGEPLIAYRYGSGPRDVVLIGGIHAGFAPSSVLLPRDLMAYYAANGSEIPDGVTLHIIPEINPDSAYAPNGRAGRVNANNVDLNRNWDCRWRPDAVWADGRPISGGAFPFSEPETVAVRDYLLAVAAEVAIFYEARASGGLVTPGECNGTMSGSRGLMQTYQAATLYRWQEGIAVTGDASNWAAAEGITSIFVLLPDWEAVDDVDWQLNLRALRAVLGQYGQ